MTNEIRIIKDDITNLKVDCIVNAANHSLLGGGGVDGMIHSKAGNGLFIECSKLGGCKTGEAKITGGYNLPAKYIIHTVGPIYCENDKRSNEILLSDCYKNSLNLAKKHNIHSIAFPSISTGAYGYPVGEAAQIALKAVWEWTKNNKDYDICIIFCCYNEKTFQVYKNLFYN